MKASQAQETIANALQVAGLLVFVVAFYLARDILIPIALGVLVAFVLNPLVARLQRWGVTNTTAVLSSASFVFIMVVVFIISIGSSVAGLNDELPKYKTEMTRKMENVRELLGGFGRRLQDLTMAGEATEGKKTKQGSQATGTDQQEESEGQRNDGSSPANPIFVVQSEPGGLNLKSWAGGAAAILGPIGTAGLVIVFALFALLYRDDLRDRFVSVIARGNYVVTTEALNEASQRIGKYLLAQLILNVAYGVTFGIALMLIGYFFTEQRWFPYVAVLGTVAGIVRFVPYVGPLIGAGLPLALSVLLFPGFTVVAAVLALIVVMELIFNNILEPWFYGSSTGVSPMAVIMAAVFWGWLWGPIGLLLATPLTVCAVVLGQYVPRFRFLSTLLSDEIQVKAAVRAYQRLLGGEKTAISEFLKTQSKTHEGAQCIDEVLVPTVKLITADEEQRALSDEQMMRLLRTGAQDAKLIAPDIFDDGEAMPAGEDNAEDTSIQETPETGKPRIVAIPVRHVGEQLVMEAVGMCVKDLLDYEVFENDDLPDRDAQKLVDSSPQMIIVGVLPPGGMEQAKYWCSALRKAGYRGEIIVACFGKFRQFDRLLQGFRKRGASQLVTSAKQLVQKLQRLSAKGMSPKRAERAGHDKPTLIAATLVSDNSQPIAVME